MGLTCNEALSITRAGISALHRPDSSRPTRAYISLNNLDFRPRRLYAGRFDVHSGFGVFGARELFGVAA